MKFCFWFDCGYQNGLSWQCCKSCQDYHESHAKERKDGRAISKLGDSDATSRIDCAERKQLPNRFAALCEGNYAPDEIEQAKNLLDAILASSILQSMRRTQIVGRSKTATALRNERATSKPAIAVAA
jgi:hypothetical protein